MADEAPDLERQTAHLDLVSRWADDLAHEIKNPLHAMVINLELVKRRAGAGDPPAVIERAEVVESELHRVHALIDSLLRIVRPWPENTSVAVDGLFQSLLPVFTARARIRKTEYRHEGCSAIVAMAPGDLALVIALLVDRALEAEPEGGSIVTRCVPVDHHVEITVSGGAGPAETGTRARPGGPGLALTDRLVREVGGAVRTDPADGTTVLSLPLTGTG